MNVSASEIPNKVKKSFKINNFNSDGLSYKCPICWESKNFEFATICQNCKNMFCMGCYKNWCNIKGKCPMRCEDNRHNICYIVSVEKPILKFLSGNHLTNFKLNSINIPNVLNLSNYSKLRDDIINKSNGVKNIGFQFDEIEVIVDSPISKSIVKLLQKGELILKFDSKDSVDQIVENLDLDNGDKLKSLVHTIYKYVNAIIVVPDYDE